jgi:3-oxoacyl-[acyl-carrier-protein] synthase-3
MNSMTEAYITGVGAYLPGDPIDNEQLADRFGDGTARDAALRQRALAANGIRTRHYAVNRDGMTVMLNEELAAHAAERALADRGIPVSDVGMLATGTTQGDVLVPGFASMVHGRLGGRPMELLSAAGVCASGILAGHQLPPLDALGRRWGGRGGAATPPRGVKPSSGLDAPRLARARTSGVHECGAER